MKLLLPVLFAVCLAFSGCKKCYECNNGQTYCKGSMEYEFIKKSGVTTDYNGQEFKCY